MNKKLVIRILGAVFFVIELINFFYIFNFRNALLRNSLTLYGKTVLYINYSMLHDFFIFELVIFFVTLFIVAAIIDLAK